MIGDLHYKLALPPLCSNILHTVLWIVLLRSAHLTKKYILTFLTLLPFYPNLQIFHLAQIIKVPDRTS